MCHSDGTKGLIQQSCGLEMPQFPRDLLVSLPVPKPRVADNLVKRALSQAVGSDDLNLLKLVQNAFHHLWCTFLTL